MRIPAGRSSEHARIKHTRDFPLLNNTPVLQIHMKYFSMSNFLTKNALQHEYYDLRYHSIGGVVRFYIYIYIRRNQSTVLSIYTI